MFGSLHGNSRKRKHEDDGDVRGKRIGQQSDLGLRVLAAPKEGSEAIVE